MPAILVIAIRLIVPLAIFRWPLAGGLLAMAVDAFDVVLVDAIAKALGQAGEFGPFYAQIDKWLDTYYLAIEAIVIGRWPEPLLRRTAWALFGWRLIGVVAFEITAMRPLLVVFPNLFENFYLYVLITRRWASRLVPRRAVEVAIVLVALLIPKELQEYVLHWEELHPWQWLRQTLFGIPES